MDIKKANVNLLLGKIGDFLAAMTVEKKNDATFIEVEKALAKLKELFAGKDGEIELLACQSKRPVIGG